MAKQKAYELRFVFPTFQDLKDFVSLHTKDGHTYREADALDLTLPILCLMHSITDESWLDETEIFITKG